MFRPLLQRLGKLCLALVFLSSVMSLGGFSPAHAAAPAVSPSCPSNPVRSNIICPTIYTYKSTFTSQNLGFDVCTAPNTSVMQSWWTGTPYYWANIYIGGLNRGCSQPNLDYNWVDTVAAQGWRLVPTWVDYQSPCEDSSGYGQVMSWNANTAYNQGVTAANNAAAAAENIDIGPGTIIYDDIEDFSGSSSCYLAVASFVNGWSTQLHALRFKAGIYENACCSNLSSLCSYASSITPPDDIWIASWNGDSSVAGIATLPPSGCWANQQRLHQYQGNVTQTNGGAQLQVDLDSANGGIAST